MTYLKKILFAIGTFILVIATALFILWYNLETLTRPSVLSAIQKQWLPEANIEWDKVSIKISNQSFYKKTLDLQVNDFTCLQWKKNQFCLKEFHMVIPLVLKPNFEYKITKAKLVSDKSKIYFSDFINPYQEPADFNINENLLQFQSFLIFFLSHRPKQLEIDIRNSQLFADQEVHKFDFFLNDHEVSLKYAKPGLNIDIKTDGLKLSENQIHLKLQALIVLKKQKIESQIESVLNTDAQHQITLQIYDRSDWESRRLFRHLESKMSLKIHRDSSQLKIQDLDFKPDYGFESLLGKSCHISFESKTLESTHWKCHKLNMTRFETKGIKKIKNEAKALANMFSDLEIETEGYLSEKYIFAEKREKLAEINLKAKSTQKGFLNLDFKTRLEFFQSDKKISWNIKNLDTKVNVRSFQEIVQKLKKTRWAIPMPFNTLDGDVEFNIQDLSSKDEQTSIQGSVRINLKGKGSQSLQLTADGNYLHSYDVKSKPHFLNAKISLDKVTFHLPPIDPLRGIPTLTDDSRVSVKEVKTQNIALEYDISIQSKKEDSIQIYYKHFKPFLTASLSGNLTTKQNSFSFKVHEPFDISYLRREVKIQNFKVENNRIEENKFSIDGRMTYTASGYLIFIDLLGNIESPNVNLSSQPDLPRDDIISLLLYKRTRSELSSSQRQNVGGTDAALTDRAIGLIGIWAFASTPIESVYYNSQDQSYQAVISLPGEIKLNVGTDWESTQFVGLRKRLSNRWSLVTGYESGDEQGVGNIFLQREYSY